MTKRKQRQRRHVPQRTCIVCRQKTDKRRLTRIVRTQDEGVIADPSGKRNGRGAYLCDQAVCWDAILTDARMLNQALMTRITAEELSAISAFRPTGDEVV